LVVSSVETVEDLKAFMGEDLERYMDEMTVIINMAYPYPLRDELRLGRLLVEHRHLILRVHEGGSAGEVTETEEEAESVWWAQPVPLRYLQRWGGGRGGRGGGGGREEEEGCDVLDLRYLVPSGISRIRAWLYHLQSGHLPVKEIWLLGTHPHVGEILFSLAEDILTLGGLEKIRVWHPESNDYCLPTLSVSRHESLRQDGWSAHLTRDALVYLYQHLATDRYCNQVEQVEIIIDAGLLPNQSERERWFP
jgi:hypothetical protein